MSDRVDGVRRASFELGGRRYQLLLQADSLLSLRIHARDGWESLCTGRVKGGIVAWSGELTEDLSARAVAEVRKLQEAPAAAAEEAPPAPAAVDMMAPAPKRKRSAKAHALSLRTRAAYLEGRALAEALAAAALPEPEARLLAELQADLETLSQAPTLRIAAARRVQGARSRRQTAAQALFDACAEVRRRVKSRYRGPRHAELRRAFGEGAPASPSKPETVLALAAQVLAAAPQHEAALREVRVGPPTLERIAKLRQELEASASERSDLRRARRATAERLDVLAARVEKTCAALRPAVPAPAAAASAAEGRAP